MEPTERARTQMSRDRLEMRVNLADHVDGDAWKACCWNIAGGVTLREWCEKVGLPIAAMMKYIEESVERTRDYEEARRKCREVMMQEV